MNSAADDLLRGGRTGLWSAIGVAAGLRADVWLGLTDLETAIVTVVVAGVVGYVVNRIESAVGSTFLVPKDRQAGDAVLK